MSCSLYFHIPFCTKKCPYCHFYVTSNRKNDQRLLQEALLLEWEQQKEKLHAKTIPSIYWGGGTPSLFEGLSSILPFLPRSPDCEMTIEANPEESSKEMFASFLSLGINRLSLGVQSLDDRSLQTLERIHTAEKAKQAIFAAFEAGFQNISIDLMYDLPDQTEASWRYTLEQLKDLPIQHLSLYNLTIEPHTGFFRRKLKTLPQELSYLLLQMALEELDSLGFERYEISAFCRSKKRSLHNLRYWTFEPFLGFGPSAFSYFEGSRFSNVCNLKKYAKKLQNQQSPIDFQETLSQEESLKERIAVQLRVKEGIDVSPFPLGSELKSTLDSLEKKGFLLREESRYRLSDKGMLFYDTVAAEII